MENKYVSGIIGIGLFLLGGLCGKSIPNTNTNSNGNTITISQEVPTENFKNFEKNSKNLKKNEKISKKININKATLQEFKDAKVSIGDSKYSKIIELRPFSTVEELKTKGILGHYAYDRHKHRFTVGD